MNPTTCYTFNVKYFVDEMSSEEVFAMKLAGDVIGIECNDYNLKDLSLTINDVIDALYKLHIVKSIGNGLLEFTTPVRLVRVRDYVITGHEMTEGMVWAEVILLNVIKNFLRY